MTQWFGHAESPQLKYVPSSGDVTFDTLAGSVAHSSYAAPLTSGLLACAVRTRQIPPLLKV